MENYENEKTVLLTMKMLKWEIRKKKAKDFIKSLPHKVKDIWDNDKEVIMLLAPGVIYVIRRIAKHNDEKKETYHRDCQVFDRSLGMWHDLKRPMTTKEKIEFAKRKKEAKEDTLYILVSMGLLKK